MVVASNLNITLKLIHKLLHTYECNYKYNLHSTTDPINHWESFMRIGDHSGRLTACTSEITHLIKRVADLWEPGGLLPSQNSIIGPYTAPIKILHLRHI
jgi:hypothetical protein